MNTAITLRPICAEDEAFLYQTYASTRAEEMAVVNWPEAATTAFLQMQFNAQRQHFLTHYPTATYAIIQLDELAIGRLIVNRTEEEISLMDIALLPGYRNRGIGANLIQALQVEAGAAGKPVRLHVHNFSPAVRLYQRLGFTVIAEQAIYSEMEWRPTNVGSSKSGLQIEGGTTHVGDVEAAFCV